ncbi:PE family protein [Mycobacterium decipiens]|uniref:PE family protein n=1 Tax=Mycobacterium decipiens TaxID=1430326 RepID=A0A1X2LTH4_9MYCO|nr:PE family protein [Mycobacterium decipiens]OSC40073.1 PE family protein [Mycobacterium decipiens]
MSFLLTAPEALAAAAADLSGIGSTLNVANAVAAVPTTGVLAAAADGVSAQVAALFSAHAQGYQQLSRQMMAAFQDQFVLALRAGANSYAAAEASAAQTMNAVNAPAKALLGHPLMGGGTSTGGMVANALGRVQSMFLGTGGSSALGGNAATNALATGALQLSPTGGAGGLSAASALLPRAGTAAAAALPALALGSIGNEIKYLYNALEPWVQYGFNLTAWAVGWLPYVGILAPQINFFYFLGEPIVQSVLFNTIDFLDGTVTFSQALNNIGTATTASINQFINTEINWIRGFLPPFPPVSPPGFPSLP